MAMAVNLGGTIEAIRGARVTAAIGEGHAVNRESPVAVTLLQCVPRGDRMDFIVQKAAELGVARITPVVSQRSVVRLDAEQANSKRLHWHAVAVSACEQCGRNTLPAVATPEPLLSYLGALTGDDSLRLVFEPSVNAASAPSTSSARPAELIVAIGPEGGFAEDELEAFGLAGFAGVSLGPRILRQRNGRHRGADVGHKFVTATCWRRPGKTFPRPCRGMKTLEVRRRSDLIGAQSTCRVYSCAC